MWNLYGFNNKLITCSYSLLFWFLQQDSNALALKKKKKKARTNKQTQLQMWEGSRLSECITLISPANRKWIAEWQFETQQGKNIPRSTGPALWAVSVLLHLRLRMLMLLPGIYYGGDWPPDTRQFLWVTNTGRRSWITREQAKYNDLLNTCIWAHRGKKKRRHLMLKVL